MNTSVPSLSAFPIDLSAEDIRTLCAQQNLVPFTTLTPGPQIDEDNPEESLAEILGGDWKKQITESEDFLQSSLWNDENSVPARRLHGWDPLEVLLQGFHLTHDSKLFSLAFLFARNWLEYEMPEVLPLILPSEPHLPPQGLHQLRIGERRMRWQGAALVERLSKLAYLTDVIARLRIVDDATLLLFYRSMVAHHIVLMQEDVFSADESLGLILALGQLIAAKRFSHFPGMSTVLALSRKRLKTQIEGHFFDSGCHRHHSPGYHDLAVRSFLGARHAGLLNDEGLADVLLKAEENLAWMIKPDGILAAIGDTDPQRMAGSLVLAKRYLNPYMRFWVSNGSVGAAPKTGVHALADAGYVFARMLPHASAAPREAAYLAQIVGFHSQHHKHADNLSFVWHDREVDVLIDPGRYAYEGRAAPGSALWNDGFYYSDPKRVYAESTRAHNTVEINGANHQRNKVRPFGSALRSAGEQGALVVTASEMVHDRKLRHWRGLVMLPGRFLVVVDWLYDRSGTKYDFRQHFHLDKAWVAARDSGIIKAAHQSSNGLKLCVASLLPTPMISDVVCGQTYPCMQGWVSPAAHELVPAPSFHVGLPETDCAIFATLFTFGDTLKALPPGPVSRSFRTARLSWVDANGRTTLHLERPLEGPFTARIESQPETIVLDAPPLCVPVEES